jgi:hypothetical protein
MNEIEVPLKITGVTEIRKQLKDLKSEYISATDPSRMAEIADQAGNLQKKLDGATKAFAGFTEGTNLEQTQNAFTNLKDSVMNLDFAKAGKQASVFNQTLKALKPEDFMSQISGLGKTFMGLGQTIGIVSKQFIAFGLSLLANPIFLLVAVIVAIVVAILLVMHKMGILKKVIDALMKPINDLIQGFKDLTDWLGLTSYAAEENAAKMLEANEKIMESSKERQETIVGNFDYEIRMAKIYGQDTLDLELNKSKAIGSEAKKRLSSSQKALDAQLALGDKADKETVKKLKTAIKEENKIVLEQRRDRNAIVAQDRVDKQADAKKELEEDKKNNKERHKAAIDAAKKRAEDERKFAENRLAAARLIKDIEISLIKSDADREIVATQEKYARLQEDLIKNENYSAEEKIRLKQLYQQQLEAELGKQEQVEIDAEKAKQKALLDEYNAGLIKQYEEQDKQYLKLQELTQSQTEFAKTQLAQKFDAEIAAAGENQELIKALTTKYQTDLNKIDQDAADAKVKLAADTEAKIRAEQLATANNALDISQKSITSIQNLGDIAFAAKMAKVKKGSKEEEEIAKKQFKFNKAMQLAGAIVDAGKAVTASLAAAPLAIGVVPNPIGIASLAAAVTTSALNISKIAATQFTSTGGGGGGGGIPSASSTSTTGTATPSVNLFGQGNDMNNVGANGQTQTNEITVNAIVSETELTNTQNKVAKINKNATL